MSRIKRAAPKLNHGSVLSDDCAPRSPGFVMLLTPGILMQANLPGTDPDVNLK